jgi:hypothetical protein
MQKEQRKIRGARHIRRMGLQEYIHDPVRYHVFGFPECAVDICPILRRYVACKRPQKELLFTARPVTLDLSGVDGGFNRALVTIMACRAQKALCRKHNLYGRLICTPIPVLEKISSMFYPSAVLDAGQ